MFVRLELAMTFANLSFLRVNYLAHTALLRGALHGHAAKQMSAPTRVKQPGPVTASFIYYLVHPQARVRAAS